MIPRGKGEDKEHSDRVIRDVLERWDVIIGKTTNRKGDKENEVDYRREAVRRYSAQLYDIKRCGGIG